MALDSYSGIKTAVGTWLARDDLTLYLADLMTLGEARIYRELKVRQMETAFSGVIASGTVALPTGFRGFKSLAVSGSPRTILKGTDLDTLMREFPSRSADGCPTVYAFNGATVEFGRYPDSAYTIVGTYWKRLTALSDSNTTNWLTDDAPELMLWAALCEAAVFVKDDPRIAVWEGKYGEAKARLENEQRMETSGLSMRAA